MTGPGDRVSQIGDFWLFKDLAASRNIFKASKQYESVPFKEIENQLTQHFVAQNLEIKVEIVEQLKTCLPFLKARFPNAVILSYLGFRHEVIPIMQIISHTTRAYIINADCLKGFLV